MRISDWSSDVCSSDLSEVGDFLALNLDAVDAQEGPAFAGGQWHAIGIVDAAKAALVLGYVQCTRGEAAGISRCGARDRAPAAHAGSLRRVKDRTSVV